jgi:hypothetical protein
MFLLKRAVQLVRKRVVIFIEKIAKRGFDKNGIRKYTKVDLFVKTEKE